MVNKGQLILFLLVKKTKWYFPPLFTILHPDTIISLCEVNFMAVMIILLCVIDSQAGHSNYCVQMTLKLDTVIIVSK